MFGGGGAGGGFSGGFGGAQGGFGGFGGFGGPDLGSSSTYRCAFHGSDHMVVKHNVSTNGQNFDIKIPAGIKSGETMRVRGKGKQYQGQAGDLLIKSGSLSCIE